MAVHDAISAADKSTDGACLADLDFMSTFDLLFMDWVCIVLQKKGLHAEVICRIKCIMKIVLQSL